MNDLISKIKNLDYKTLALKHGEKIGLGLVIVFTVIALYQTAWGTFKKTPEELVKLAKTAMTNLTIAPWPEDQKQQFVVGDLTKEAKSMETAMNLDKLNFPIAFTEPLYPRMQPAEEPKLSTVLSLIVDSGDAPFPMAAKNVETEFGKPQPTGDGAPRKTAPEPFEVDPELVTKTDRDAAPAQAKADAAPGGAGGQGLTMQQMRQKQMQMQRGMEDGEGGGGGGPQPNRPNRRGGKAGTGLDLPGDAGGPAVAAAPATPAIHGRGVRFAAIRGVFPFEQQARQMAEALHISLARAADQIEFDDFEIQRQRRIVGEDPWAGPWETLDYSTALDVLDEVTNYAPDVVRTEVTNNVITMALPERIRGTWHILRVGHPELQQYLMDEDTKREAEMKLNQELLEQAKKMNLDQQKQRRRPGRGFSGRQRDLNQVRRSVQAAALQNPEIEVQMMQSRRAQMERNADGMNIPEPTRIGGQKPQGLASVIGSDPFAIPKFILFRYFDFTVEPGECYRYRVRLVFLNPNYRKSLEKVVSAEVAQSETLKSDWSEPSAQVFIKPDVHVFLAQVPRVRKSRGDGGALEIFEWDPQFGTTVRAQLKQSFGQPVGGSLNTEVLDPFSQSLGNRDVVVRTRQIFVDSASIPPLPLSENPDLQIDPKRFEALEKSGAFEQAVTVSHSGDLLELVPLATTTERQKALHDSETEKKFFQHWRAAKEDPAAATGGKGGLDGPELDRISGKNAGKGAAKGKNAKKSPQANPLKFGAGDGPNAAGGPPGGRGRGMGGGGGKNR